MSQDFTQRHQASTSPAGPTGKPRKGDGVDAASSKKSLLPLADNQSRPVGAVWVYVYDARNRLRSVKMPDPPQGEDGDGQ